MSKTSDTLADVARAYKIVQADLQCIREGKYNYTLNESAMKGLDAIVNFIAQRKLQFEEWTEKEKAKETQGPVN